MHLAACRSYVGREHRRRIMTWVYGQPTSKLLENPEFTRPSRMNLARRSVW